MNRKKALSCFTFLLALVMVFVSINNISGANRAAAYIVKEPSTASGEDSLKPIVYNGEEMYVAKSTFYDYHSDNEIGPDATPKAITGALDSSKNTFEQFNYKLFNLMKYGSSTESPANYPMYQGRLVVSGLYSNIYRPGDEVFNTSTNYWVAANSPQGDAKATQGLVDSKLSTNQSGESVLMQSNSTTGKSAAVPYFNKAFLTSNKFDNSELTLGTVRENMSFPFRKVIHNGVTYYQYFSNEDTIRINSNNEVEYKGYKNSAEQVKDSHGDAGFFPYNTASESGSNSLNYGHGLKIEVPFIITSDGKINGKNIKFEFSGDDDVWVFIDGQLALDIGGSHGEIKGTLDFVEQTSVISKVKSPTAAFASHSTPTIGNSDTYNNYKASFSDALKNVLRDTTKVHTLTFFYMERGMDVANLKLNFNLPEPTKLKVSNSINLDKVNEPFKNATNKVAAKDIFMYDIVDKSLNKRTEMVINNKEAVTFANEFRKDDTMIVQQSKLQNTNRDMSHYYTTDWALKDTSAEIAKASNSLVVDDNRTSEDRTFKFANKDNSETPVLTAAYINAPKIGTFTIKAGVTDAYKSKHSDYATHTFKYTVTHKNIFNGDSAETKYEGKYTITKADGTTETKTATAGSISLKAGEKATITGIPVDTVLIAKAELKEKVKLSKVAKTSNFTLDEAKTTATGKINSLTNILEFTYTTDEVTEAPKEDEIETPQETTAPEQELHNVSDIKPSQSENNANIDDTPGTSDNAMVQQWIWILILSGFACLASAISVAKKN